MNTYDRLSGFCDSYPMTTCDHDRSIHTAEKRSHSNTHTNAQKGARDKERTNEKEITKEIRNSEKNLKETLTPARIFRVLLGKEMERESQSVKETVRRGEQREPRKKRDTGKGKGKE